MFYDEANRLPRDISVDMLISIGEALSQTGVMGAYAASPEMVLSSHHLEPLFGGQLPLGAFGSFDDMRRLLARYYFDDLARIDELPVTGKALNILWEISRCGEPFLIQLIADRSFRIARRSEAAVVNDSHVEQAHSILHKERPNAFDPR